MKYLVGDIGNTLTKITLLNERFKIIKSKSIDSKRLYNKNYLSIFFKNFLFSNLNSKILFSSVVPSVYKNIKLYLKKKGFKSYEIKELKVSKIIKLNVNNFKQLGSDRIVNAIGSYNQYKKNCLVIDFGTATTFDIVKKPGIYEGGVIAPGIKLSIINLNKSTALLPLLNLKTNAKSYGKNTKDALNAGFLWGYKGLINSIIKKIVSATKSNYKIILTGGYSKLFKKHIGKKSIIDDNITTKGIIKVYKDLLL
jgi:type III pantothenate kinase